MTAAQNVPLWQILSSVATEHSDNTAGAVAALMRAASAILQRDFGDDAAASMMIEIVADAASKITGSSGIVATRH